MLFSAKADYACVAMLELAAHFGASKPVRLVEIAEKHGISHPYLVQILLHLKGAGLVLSTRGPSGGYTLARPPTEITLYDVVHAVDGREQGPRQKGPPPPNLFIQNIHSVWDRILQAQQDLLKKTTLADLEQQNQASQYVI